MRGLACKGGLATGEVGDNAVAALVSQSRCLPESRSEINAIRTDLNSGHKSPKIEAVKSRQFLKLLKSAGAEIIRNRGKGDHYLVRLNGKSTTVPVHGDTDYDPDFLDDICKQLNARLRDIQK